jgi:hypothetical protein
VTAAAFQDCNRGTAGCLQELWRRVIPTSTKEVGGTGRPRLEVQAGGGTALCLALDYRCLVQSFKTGGFIHVHSFLLFIVYSFGVPCCYSVSVVCSLRSTFHHLPLGTCGRDHRVALPIMHVLHVHTPWKLMVCLQSKIKMILLLYCIERSVPKKATLFYFEGFGRVLTVCTLQEE